MSAGVHIDLASVAYGDDAHSSSSSSSCSPSPAHTQPTSTPLPSTPVQPTSHPYVLENIHIHIQPGEFLLLTGSSGGGKSTLIRLLNGLIPHYTPATIHGCVNVTGSHSFSPLNEPLWITGDAVATVFQNPRTQFFTTDVTSELAFALENRALDPAAIRARISAVAPAVGVEDLLDRSLFKLSGGERQLVACACAVTQGPQLYLFDEPTSNLSPAAIERFSNFLKQLKSTGATVVIAEHRLHFLKELADRAIIVDHTVIADMPAHEFFSMSDAERLHYGLRQLSAPRTEITTTRINPRGTCTLFHEHAYTTPATTSTLSTVPLRSRSTTSIENCYPESTGLELLNLTAQYGRRQRVLNIARMHFPRGAVTAITGENGVGKSTLASVICGLKKQSSGHVYLDGRDLTERERLSRSYMVMQDVHRQLFSESVHDEILLGSEPTDSLAASDLAASLLQRFDLNDVSTRHPLSLSGGQKQRVVVAAATALDRDVYVFDEPSSGLDQAHMNGVAAALRDLAAAGKVVILITHDPELINSCADHSIALINEKI